MSRPAYPHYRPSGIEWLGDVPQHWSAIPVKRRYEIQLGKMLQNNPESDTDVSVPYAKALHVRWGKVDTSDLPDMWASPSDIKHFGVKSGDLLVCEGGEAGRAGIVDSAPVPCIIQNALHRVRGKGADVRFLLYVLQKIGSGGWFDVLCNRATISHFTREKLAELRVPMPVGPGEQRAIAAFLDRETARIDALIERKRRQIELLQEKRSALINHAVTKGLDSHAPMKDSGVEWFGDVPEHWSPVRLRYRAKINSSRSELDGTPGTLDISFVPMESVHEYGGLSLDQTRPLAEVATGYTYFRDGDVLAAKITPCFENGKGSIAQDLVNGIGCGTTELHVLRPYASLGRRFLFYVTISHAFRHLGAGEMYGAGGQKRVPEDFFRNFRQPIPPLAEQRAIAAFLDRETARIDALIEKVDQSIATLREHRIALISAAVTGKIDVRGEVA